jgi:hypothetical protein
MDIELLYFDDCPAWQYALANLHTALAEENIDVQVHLVKIQSADEAQGRRFLGSPSIYIGGEDLWSEEREGYFWGCRIYNTPEGLRGWPTVEMIRERLSERISSNTRGER